MKRKENPRIIAMQRLQAHYEDRMNGGLSLKNKVRRSVGLSLVDEASLTEEQYQDIMSKILSTVDEIKRNEN